VLVDPRLEKEGVNAATLQEQLVFENKVIHLLSDARKFQAAVEAEIKKSTISEKKATLEKVLKELKNEEGAYPQQMLVAQISYLSYIVGGVDKTPGNEEKERYKVLSTMLSTLKSDSSF
jgi:NADH:ubiquinone oxidoreductase subunit C